MEFELIHVFNVLPEVIFTSFLDSKAHTEMTGAEANVSDREGDEFTAWDGYISGRNVELEQGRKIIQFWRTTEFDEGQADSLIEIQLEPTEDGQTVLRLLHKNLPESDDQYINGWQDYYFKPMEIYFNSLKR